MRRNAVLLVIPVILVITCLFPTNALGYKKLTTIKTRGCSSQAATWTVQYRLYFRNSQGDRLTRSRSEMKASIAQAREFARMLGWMSGCGARARIVVVDMEHATWRTTNRPAYPTSWHRTSPGRINDVILNRFPKADETYAGIAYFQRSRRGLERVIDFPAQDPRNEFSTPQPIAGLILHEWLHHAVMFYTRAPWPRYGVHGACQHGYTGSCSVNLPYFRDMLRGRVRDGNRYFGIKRRYFWHFGSPLDRGH